MSRMSDMDFLTPVPVFIEIRATSWFVIREDVRREVPVERGPDGRLAISNRAGLVEALRTLIAPKPWQSKVPAYCAIGSRGISFRRMPLPAVAEAELPKVLPLQIEAEFPLAPQDLAWGFQIVPVESGAGSGEKREVLVVAIRKETLAEYGEILESAGASPIYTVAAFARNLLVPTGGGVRTLIDFGEGQTELSIFQGGVPVQLRSLPWGLEHLGRSLQGELKVESAEARRLVNLWLQNSPAPELQTPGVRQAISTSLDALAGSLTPYWKGGAIYLSGLESQSALMAAGIASRLARGASVQWLESGTTHGKSAAVLGLAGAFAAGTLGSLPTLRVNPTLGGAERRKPTSWKALAVPAALAVACLLIPSLEALTLKPGLSRRIEATRAQRGKLTLIDRELGFLQYLDQNQPPYLAATYLLSDSIPMGTRIESLGMNRQGEVSLRATIQNAQQVADFRGKLIDSGFFSTVVVEEQTPTPDRQRLSIRVTAQWKAPEERESLNIGPKVPDADAAKSSGTNSAGSTNAIVK